MKKYSLLIILLVSVIGCANSKSEKNSKEPKPESIVSNTGDKAVDISATEKKSASDARAKSASTVEKAVQSKKKEDIKVTFVELGSVGCVPCRMMQPVMDEIEKEYEGQVKVIFYDVWKPEGRPYAQKYDIRAIPTQVFLDKNGKEYYRHVGYFPKEELVKILKMQGIK